MKALSDNFYVAGQLEPEHFQLAKESGISLIINNRPDGEQEGQMTAETAQKLATDLGIDYLHLPMANGQPLPNDLIPNMQTALLQQQNKQGSTLAHCRSGTRSSFLWGAIQIIEGNCSPEEIIGSANSIGINLNGFLPVFKQIEASLEQK